ncbi:LysR substrate-binding domain-containing protein [Pantoea sp. B65]|uniref:LysR substrate-binding domain-containing protein n=1 Tax=Pantoea sp. B65 TaxID=2813359 RepID=UPI0039B37B56
MARQPTFDLEALRSFVTGIDLGSFALAADRLNRSTSAVSAQLKKLEAQSGLPLVQKVGRHLQVTHRGELLLTYARRLLALNDEAAIALSGHEIGGHIRVGMQEDFGESLLPDILGQFSRAHPQVQIFARIGRNAELLQGIREDELDLALCWMGAESTLHATPLGATPLYWIARGDIDVARWISRGEPLPLLLFDAPCLLRNYAIEALERAGIPWRVAFSSRSLGGIWAAAAAGLGITIRTTFGMPANLSILRDKALPVLPPLGIALHRRTVAHSAALTLLQSIIADQLT